MNLTIYAPPFEGDVKKSAHFHKQKSSINESEPVGRCSLSIVRISVPHLAITLSIILALRNEALNTIAVGFSPLLQ